MLVVFIRRFFLVQALLVKFAQSKAQARITFLRSQGSLASQIKESVRIFLVERILIDAQQLAIALVTSDIFLPPDGIIVPLLATSLASLFMPADHLVGMLEILAMRPCTHCNRDFFAVKVLLRVVWDIFAQMAPRKCKMSTEKAGPRTSLGMLPVGQRFRQKEDATFRCKHMGCHAPRLMDSAYWICQRFVRGYLGCQNGPRTLIQRTLKHVNQEGIPVLDKAHMTVELQRVHFAILHLLNLVPSPTSSTSFVTRHIQNSKLLIVCLLVKVIVKRIFDIVLIANAKDEIFGIFCLGQCVLHCLDELRISLRCNLNEDGHLSLEASDRQKHKLRFSIQLFFCFEQAIIVTLLQ